MMKDSDRIAVTGMGVVSPIGIGVDAFHQGLTEGRDGILDDPLVRHLEVCREVRGCEVVALEVSQAIGLVLPGRHAEAVHQDGHSAWV